MELFPGARKSSKNGCERTFSGRFTNRKRVLSEIVIKNNTMLFNLERTLSDQLAKEERNLSEKKSAQNPLKNKLKSCSHFAKNGSVKGDFIIFNSLGIRLFC